MVLVLRPLTKEARILVWGKRETSLKDSLFKEEPRFAQHSPILKFDSIFHATEHHLMWCLGCRISSLARLCPPLSIASDLTREHSPCPLYDGVPCIQKRSSLLPMEFASPNLGVLRLWNVFMAVELDFVHCLHSCKCSHTGGVREPEFQSQSHWE